MLAQVGARRLFLPDLTDEHLTALLRATQYRPEESVDAWLKEIAAGTLEVHAWPSDLLVGVRKQRTRLWIEFIAGRGLFGREAAVLAWLQSYGLPIATLATRPGMYRLAHRLGFVPVAVEMRRD